MGSRLEAATTSSDRPTPMWTRLALAVLTLWLSMLILRQDVVTYLRITTADALESGMGWGWYFDGVMCMVVLTLSVGLGLIHPSAKRWMWLASASFVWLASVANTLYIQFFDSPLNWWVVRLHWNDITAIHESAAELSIGPIIPLSLVLLAGSCTQAFRAFTYPKHQPTTPKLVGIARVLLLALVVLVGWRGPAWLHVRDSTALLRDNIVRSWLVQNFKRKLFYGVENDWMTRLQDDTTSTKTLAAYRALPAPFPEDTPTGGDISHRAGVSEEQTAELRRSLGLPETAPINVLILFAESLRTYELNHPKIGPAIFPNLQRRLREQAVYFTDGYSSSFNSGQTVRGQFSTLCGMLPNISGAATYLAHTNLQTDCIQKVLKDAGYATGWFNSFKAAYHNKKLFESLHGTDHFFDETYYKAHGITEKIGSWGLADKPVLKQTAQGLADFAAAEGTIFAHMLTISTHHPQPVIPGADVPASLLEELGANSTYHGLLSSYRYLDEAIEGFFESFFAGPLADNTLIVLLGDHGTPHRPPDVETNIQHRESRFRIPIALITKNATPKKLSHVVHQIDVAPTIAQIVGIRPDVTWMGRGLFAEPGSPWVFYSNGKSSYRNGQTACYHMSPNPEAASTCLDLSHGDPLYDSNLPVVPEDPRQTQFFDHVVQAVTNAIALNKLRPVSSRSPSREGQKSQLSVSP